jgi:hypothetical protein
MVSMYLEEQSARAALDAGDTTQPSNALTHLRQSAKSAHQMLFAG